MVRSDRLMWLVCLARNRAAKYMHDNPLELALVVKNITRVLSSWPLGEK